MFLRPRRGNEVPAALNLTGQRFTRLTVHERSGKTQRGQWKYRCVCDCGKELDAATGWLRSGRYKSCGCYSADMARTRLTVHGKSKQYEHERGTYVLRKYGLTAEQYNAMLDSQNSKCPICGYKFGQKKGDVHVDHNHTTGQVRGLLCDKCNRGLGYFKDNSQVLLNAAAYLGGSNVSPAPAR